VMRVLKYFSPAFLLILAGEKYFKTRITECNLFAPKIRIRPLKANCLLKLCERIGATFEVQDISFCKTFLAEVYLYW